MLLNVAVFGCDAGEAVSRQRLHHQWQPDEVVVEQSVPGSAPPVVPGSVGAVVDVVELERFGHRVKAGGAVGNVQVISRSGRPGGSRLGTDWEAACDPRKGGHSGWKLAWRPLRGVGRGTSASGERLTLVGCAAAEQDGCEAPGCFSLL